MGNTWEQGPVILGFFGADANVLYCGTTGPFGGSLHKSLDSGSTWFPLHCDPDTIPVPACAALREGVIALNLRLSEPETLMASVGERLLVSYDGGATWQYLTLPVQNAYVQTVSDVHGFDDVVLAGTKYSGLYRSVEHGESWLKVATNFPDNLNVEFLASDPCRPGRLAATVYVPGGGTYHHDVLESIDAGATWTSTGFPDSTYPSEIAFGSCADPCLLVGTIKGVYRKVLLNTVAEEMQDFKPPHLLLYPVPSNGQVFAVLEGLPNGEFTVQIFDVLGRRQRTQRVGIQGSGGMHVPLDLEDLSSGMYVLTMAVGKQRLSGKLLIVR